MVNYKIWFLQDVKKKNRKKENYLWRVNVRSLENPSHNPSGHKKHPCHVGTTGTNSKIFSHLPL
jgi:hypothetical protein